MNKIHQIYKQVQVDYKNGLTNLDLQKKYGKSKNTINKCLNYGKHKNYVINGLTRDMFVNEYFNNLLSSNEIAKKYNIKVSNLSYAKIMWGIYISQKMKNERLKKTMPKDLWNQRYQHLRGLNKDRWLKNPIAKEDIYNMYVIKGYSLESIIKHFNTSEQTLNKWLDHYSFFPLSDEDLMLRKKALGVLYDDIYIGSNSSFRNTIAIELENIILDMSKVKTTLNNIDNFKSEIMFRHAILLEQYINNKYSIKPTMRQFYLDNVVNKNSVSYNLFRDKIKKYHLKKLFNEDTKYDSLNESIIGHYLDKKQIDYIIHDRNELPSLELDFYIPSYQLGIEINGNAFHHSNHVKRNQYERIVDKTYHQNKLLQCMEHDIQLIPFYEPELRFQWQKELMKKRLNSLLFKKTIDRELKIVEIKERRFYEFIERHHFFEYHKALNLKNQKYISYYALIDEHKTIQLVYLKMKNKIHCLTSAYNYCYQDLVKVIMKKEKDCVIFSNVELGIIDTLDEITTPYYLNLSFKNKVLDNNDERIKRHKYYQIYNSGYQIINT